MLYTSENLALAVLEILANNKRHLILEQYGYIEIQLPENLTLSKMEIEMEDVSWRTMSYSKRTISYGTGWLKSNSTLALSVPSAVLSQENNLLINPNHLDFSSIKIIKKGLLNLDGRVAV